MLGGFAAWLTEEIRIAGDEECRDGLFVAAIFVEVFGGSKAHGKLARQAGLATLLFVECVVVDGKKEETQVLWARICRQGTLYGVGTMLILEDEFIGMSEGRSVSWSPGSRW